jgi:hypothetical protein
VRGGRGAGVLQRAVYEAATIVGRWPRASLPLARRRGHGVVLSDRTDVVIEGYPCSGNSFAVAAFALAQPTPIDIGHHTHTPAHLMAAVRRRVPAVALIREPDDAVRDFLDTRPSLTLRQAMRGYVRFYEPLLSIRDRLLVARFADVMTDFGAVVRRLNDRFATSFREFEPTPSNVARAQEVARTYFTNRPGPGLPVVGRSPAPGGPDPQPEARRDPIDDASSATTKARTVFATFTGSSE